MSKGKGGAIKNWTKANNRTDFWYYTAGKDAKMAIGNKTRKGYPISLFGEDVKSNTKYRATKKKARKYAANWRRSNTDL